MKAGRLFSMCIALVLLGAVSVAAAATPLASPCMPGSAYDPACDVDHNGTINVTDIQLAAGHWGQTGTYTETAMLIGIYRIELFGHSAHSAFTCNSTEYQSVPGTFDAHWSLPVPPVPAGAQRYFRIETLFAVNHDRIIWLRMRDPANNLTNWEYSFQGGHAPNSWWSWGTTVRFQHWNPWPCQNQLEIKASDTSGAILGSVWLVVEDVQGS